MCDQNKILKCNDSSDKISSAVLFRGVQLIWDTLNIFKLVLLGVVKLFNEYSIVM